MTAPTHIRAWVVLKNRLVIAVSDISEKQAQINACIQLNMHWLDILLSGFKLRPVTITLGHELADKLEKEK